MCDDVVPARRVLDRSIQLKHMLGIGSFGGAYFAQPCTTQDDAKTMNEHTDTCTWPQQFVVKVMKREEHSDHYVECIHREVQALRMLRHPHVPQYIDAWIESGLSEFRGCYCLATNYCNGGDMRAYIRKMKSDGAYMSKELMVHFMVQVFSALNYCHAHKIIHRDIKPANVFLHRDDAGNVEKVMLGDFGLSRPLEDTMQLARTRVGTPLYCSPEIVLGRRYGTKTDIFSAGVVFYELMTLERAFARSKGDDKLMCDAIVRQDPVPRLYDVAQARYGDGLVRVVKKCLCKSEAARPSAFDVLTSFSCRLKRGIREANLVVYNEGRKSPVKSDKSPVARQTPPSPLQRHMVASNMRAASGQRCVSAAKRGSPCRGAMKPAAASDTSLSAIVDMVVKKLLSSAEDEVLQLLDGDVEVWLLLKVVCALRTSSSASQRRRVLYKLLDCLKPTAPVQAVLDAVSKDVVL